MTQYRALITAVIFFVNVYADSAEMKPWMLKRGRKIFGENFSGRLDPEEWKVTKGKWTIENNVLKGVELEADHHPAVIRREASMRNVIIRYDFQFTGSPGFSLSMNFAGGHNSRVVVEPSYFLLKKDVNKKDPTDFPVILGECAFHFEPGQWYTMQVEYCGRELLARINTKDNKAFILGEHDYIDNERTSIGFPTRGEAMLFDNVNVWEGTPDPKWPARRKALLKIQAKRSPVQYNTTKTSWQAAENRLRARLMKEDPEFIALVQKRAAIEKHLHTTYPKAFRKGSKGAEEKKRLQAEDPNFKQLNRDLTLARRAEREYMHAKDPSLGMLYEKAKPPRKNKRAKQ